MGFSREEGKDTKDGKDHKDVERGGGQATSNR